MTLTNKLLKKVSLFGLAAGAGLGLTLGSAQAQFSPVQPDPILSGSAGFTDIYVFSEFARQQSDNEKGGSIAKTVTSNINTSPIFGELTTTNGSAVTTIDFEAVGGVAPLNIDARGRIDGICTVRTDDGEVREIPIIGQAMFRETVLRGYSAGTSGGIFVPGTPSADIKGIEPNIFPPYITTSLARNLDHELTFVGTRLGFGVKVDLRAGAFLPGNRQILGDYDTDAISMNGILRTRDGNGRRVGVSQINVTGLIDERAIFQTSVGSLSGNTTLTDWQGDARLSTPFNPSTVNGGTSRYQYRFYDTARNRPGRYRVDQQSAAVLNVPLDPTYRTRSEGYMMSTASEAQSIASGVAAISDFQYRDTFFGFRSPSALTLFDSFYNAPLSILVRNSNQNEFTGVQVAK